MYNVSEEFKTAINSNPRQILSYLTIGGVTYDKEIQSVNISAQSSDGDIIGQAVCQSFDAEMLLTKEQYSALDTSDEVVLYFGLVLSSATEYVPQGKYLIKSHSFDADKGKFKMSCVDYMAEFDKHQVKDLPTLTYPLTADDYLHAVCVKAGVIKSNETYWGNDTILTQAPNFSGTESLREVLKGLAQMCLATCYMNKSGELKMSCIIDSTAQSITAGEYFTATFGEMIIPINTVSLVRDPANDIIYAKDQAMIDVDGVSDLSISNNPFMDYDRVTFANKLLNKVKGLSFYPCEIDWRGNFALDPFEKLSVTAVDNTVKTTYLYNRETTYNGGLREKISCKGYNKKAVSYAKGTTIQDKLKNTEISVDKANQRIDAVVEGSYTKEQVNTEIESAIGLSESGVKIYVDEKTALNSHTYTTAPDKYQKNDVFVLDKEYITTQSHDFQVGQMLIAKENQDTATAQHVVCKNGDVIRFKDGTYLSLANLDFSKWDKKDKYQTDKQVSASFDVKAEDIRMDFQNGGLSSQVKFDVSGQRIFNGDFEIWDKPENDSSGKKVLYFDHKKKKLQVDGEISADNITSGRLSSPLHPWTYFDLDEGVISANRLVSDDGSGYSAKIGSILIHTIGGDTYNAQGLGFADETGYVYGYIAKTDGDGFALIEPGSNNWGVYQSDSNGLTIQKIFNSTNFGQIRFDETSMDLHSGVNNRIYLDNNGIVIHCSNMASDKNLLYIDTTQFITDVQSAYFNDLYSNGVKVTSDREKKTEIKQENVYALDRLKNINTYSYKIGETEQKIGLMYDEAPPEIQSESDKGDKRIDLYAFNSLNAKAIQELNKKFERLTNYFDDLVLENQQLRKDLEREKLERQKVTNSIKTTIKNSENK